MRRFKGLQRVPLIHYRSSGGKPRGGPGTSRVRQSGASLIAAIFVITALLALGALMTQMMVLGSEETVNEWYSTQALYAAETGVDYAVYEIQSGLGGGDGVTTDTPVIAGQAWMTTTVTATPFNGGATTLYTITSIGEAGGSSANPRAQRQIVVQFMP